MVGAQFLVSNVLGQPLFADTVTWLPVFSLYPEATVLFSVATRLLGVLHKNM